VFDKKKSIIPIFFRQRNFHEFSGARKNKIVVLLQTKIGIFQTSNSTTSPITMADEFSDEELLSRITKLEQSLEIFIDPPQIRKWAANLATIVLERYERERTKRISKGG